MSNKSYNLPLREVGWKEVVKLLAVPPKGDVYSERVAVARSILLSNYFSIGTTCNRCDGRGKINVTELFCYRCLGWGRRIDHLTAKDVHTIKQRITEGALRDYQRAKDLENNLRRTYRTIRRLPTISPRRSWMATQILKVINDRRMDPDTRVRKMRELKRKVQELRL